MSEDLQGAKPIDLSSMKSALGKGAKVYCGLALVVKRAGESAHWEKHTEDDGGTDILVEVDMMPTGEPLTCRLGAAAAGNGWGVWSIPPVGAEVIVAFPDGEMDGMDPVIMRVLSSGAVPTALDATTLVIAGAKKIHIESQDGDVEITATGKVKIQGGDQPVARKTDPVDMGTLIFVPGSGAAALTYKPAGAALGVIPPGGVTIPINGGQISDGSSKTSSG